MASTLEWRPSTYYELGFVVISPTGELLRCLTPHTSASAWAGITTNWSIVSADGRTQNSVATSAAAGANAGTSPPVPVVLAGSNDIRGNITAGSGGSPAAGAQVVVTFGRVFDTAPIVHITEGNIATAALAPAVTAVTTSGFTISTNVAPTASQANTVYSYNYLAMP